MDLEGVIPENSRRNCSDADRVGRVSVTQRVAEVPLRGNMTDLKLSGTQ